MLMRHVKHQALKLGVDIDILCNDLHVHYNSTHPLDHAVNAILLSLNLASQASFATLN